MESEIGGQLFRRGRNGTRLTDVGGLPLDRAGELVRRADQLLDDMRRAAQFQEFQLRFGELLAAGPVLLDPYQVQSFFQDPHLILCELESVLNNGEPAVELFI